MSNNHLISDVIDLTDSLILADHCALTNAIINLDSDESFYIDSSIDSHQSQENSELHSQIFLTTKQKCVQRKKSSKNKKPTPWNTELEENMRTSKFGDCPICLDELGNNPLASTKCGHVFCIKCLKQTLKNEKKCPTCRTILRGSSAYHPLYLN